tara:strand:+ start:2922 stop:3839 length:918 start_codon:yes stop_codon:yes gene_type:complete
VRADSHRVAVVDVGSNAIRCLIAEGRDFQHSRTLFEDRAPLRLGEDAFLYGEIQEVTRLKLLKAFIDWKLMFLDLGVEYVRIVATSALRNSKNRDQILNQVFEATGLQIDIIDGLEEGRLLRDVLYQRLPHVAPLSLCMDIGGGSVEFCFKDQIFSLPIGTVRLLEKVSSKSMEDFRLHLRPHLLRLKSTIDSHKPPLSLVGTGGNIKSLSRLANRLHLAKSRREFSNLAAQKISEKLFSLSFEERLERLKLNKDRADVILPASCLVDETCRIFGLSRIHAPQVGLKEGLLLNSFDRLLGHTAPS